MKTRSKLLYEQWKIMVDWVNMHLDALTDEELRSPIIDGRNHGVWILGHLIASDDTLAQHLGFGDMLYPETQMFAQSSELKEVDEYPSPRVLREQWKAVCKRNEHILRQIEDDMLDEPHAMIVGDPSDDFFRTKERVIVYWTLHQMHHAGQLAVLLSRFDRHLM